MLNELHITNVITLDSCPLPSHILQRTAVTNKYIQGKRLLTMDLFNFEQQLLIYIVSDVAKEDLISHFEDCIQFIDAALEKNQKVLVQWFVICVIFFTKLNLIFKIYLYLFLCSCFGKSASATIVIAYIMKTHRITFTPAFER